MSVREQYVVGVIEEMDKQETAYGLRVDIYLSLLKSSLGWNSTYVKAVAWRDKAEQAAKYRKPQTLMIVFDKFANAEKKYRGTEIKKVRATHVSRLTVRELQTFLTDENGQYNPFNW
ncbi:hypothetical protein [Thermaerobacillus caldiproteolyticus]|uniref:hypothetical protein n=1 Tax=Thermaerobacillus caldiproteolyticus TaxID=247480 RepID=UPI00188B84D3|nr:hypothetical protein [Anoxybacillus caldiproteolyticus]QPA33401.1 hypothetical protein ISX45_18935 [Anoxybacillus caldiproteolyticus]